MKYITEASQKLREMIKEKQYEWGHITLSSGLSITINLLDSKAIEPTVLIKLVKLSCTNMQSRHYDIYTDATAKDNIIHRHSYILLASIVPTEDDNTILSDSIIGFLAFRPIIENGKKQLYIWELQIETNYQRKGIGHLLVSTLIDLGRRVIAPERFSLCLTCSKRNETGYAAYIKMGFILNGDSDDDDPFWILELQVK